MKSTGVPSLDSILGGGLPVGVVDVYGGSGCGKTALGACLLKQAASEGRPAILVATTPIEKEFLLGLGVPETTTRIEVPNWDLLADAVVRIMHSVPEALLVVDTATALESRSNQAASLNDVSHRTYANTVVREVERMSRSCADTDGTLVLLNEARADMQRRGRIRSALSFASPWTSNLVLEMSVASTKALYGRLAYKLVDIKVLRSREVPPGGVVQVHLFAGTGIDKYLELLKQLIRENKVQAKGNYWITHAGTVLGPGYSKAAEQLKELHEASSGDGG